MVEKDITILERVKKGQIVKKEGEETCTQRG